MTSYLQKISALLLVAVVLPAWAGHNNNRYVEPVYDNGQYEYAKVVDVQPVTEIVAEYRSPAPVIFGAIVGGVIGNQLSRGHGGRHGYGYGHGRGHGNNRVAATFAGAAIGGMVADGIQYNRYPPRYYTQNVQVCSTETSWRSEERVIAWDVSWKYQGQIYHSRMDEPPGDRIRVRVSVDPVYP